MICIRRRAPPRSGSGTARRRQRGVHRARSAVVARNVPVPARVGRPLSRLSCRAASSKDEPQHKQQKENGSERHYDTHGSSVP